MNPYNYLTETGTPLVFGLEVGAAIPTARPRHPW